MKLIKNETIYQKILKFNSKTRPRAKPDKQKKQ